MLFACAPDTPDHFVRAQVVMAGPVVEAEVLLWWVDGTGHPLTKDGRRSRDERRSPENALARGRTDERGVAELPTGPAYGLLVLEARGGWTREPWIEPDAPASDAGVPCTSCDAGVGGDPPGMSPGTPDGMPPAIPNEITLHSVLLDFVPGPDSRDVVLSPLTTLAAILGEKGRTYPSGPDAYYMAMHRSYTLFGAHFGGPDLRPDARVDIARGPIPSADQPLTELDSAAMHLLALQGLAALAHRIAEASGLPSRRFHIMDLVAALLEDAGGGFLDGTSTRGAIFVGACPVPDGCGDDAPGCRTICRLDANTLRADLASAVAFEFLPSPLNRTTLTLADVRPFIEHLRTGAEPELFAGAAIAELDGPAPLIEVDSSPVFDERQDAIAFGDDAVPLHTPGGAALVDLGQEGSCPIVGKHVHRLADPGANPLRWHVVVRDRAGWPAAGGWPVSLQYRVRQRDAQSRSGDAGSAAGGCEIGNDDTEQAWLTDWIAAEPMASVEDGVMYEITLLRDRVPQLATLPRAELEIVFRGRDALGKEVTACRCWNHELLPVPLEIGEITVATGTGSLSARSLHPGNNVAPLLNGVPLDQAPVLASFEIRNGTDETAYVSLAIEQPLVRYTKCWQGSNAQLSFEDNDDPGCVARGDCLADFPPDRQTLIAVDSGVIEHLFTGIRIQDLTTGSITTVELCAGCEVPEHIIEPRTASTSVRVYRVELLVSDLRALAPHSAAESPGWYVETALAPPFLTPITGLTSAAILDVCLDEPADGCTFIGAYQYYRSVTAAELTFDDRLAVHALTATLPRTSLQATAAVLRELESFTWSTSETILPTFFPAPQSPPACPIVNGSVF